MNLSKRFTTMGVLALVVVLAALTAAFAATGDTSDTASDVVVVVNGKAITQSDFYAQLENVAGANVLQQMVAEQLLKQAAADAGFEATDDAIQAEIDKVKGQFPSEEAFMDALKQYNMTLDSFKTDLRMALTIEFLGTKDVVVSDEDVQNYFNENKAEYGTSERVNASHILVKDKEEAAKILSRVQAGEDFAELAKEFSQDPGSAPRGGNLGFFERGDMVESFENAAFSLAVGEVSGLVESQFGFHIIKVIERQEAQEADFADVKSEIREKLISEQAKDPQTLVNELLPSANIEVKWEKYSDIF